jgi:hypothetical protein
VIQEDFFIGAYPRPLIIINHPTGTWLSGKDFQGRFEKCLGRPVWNEARFGAGKGVLGRPWLIIIMFWIDEPVRRESR